MRTYNEKPPLSLIVALCTLAGVTLTVGVALDGTLGVALQVAMLVAVAVSLFELGRYRPEPSSPPEMNR